MFRKIMLALTLIALLSGCSLLKELVKQPTVDFEGVALQEISLSEETLLFRFRVNNPNPLPIKLTSISYDLMINERNLASGTKSEGINLPGEGAALVELPFTIRHLELFDSLDEFINTDEVTYTLKGSMGLGPIELPYKKSGTIRLPRLPQITLKKLEVEKFSFSGAAVVIVVDIRNDNDFPLKLDSLNYQASLSGVDIISGNTGQLPRVEARSSATIEIPLSVSFAKLGKSLANLLAGQSADYQFSGDINLPAGGKLPFKADGEIPIER